MVAGTLVFAQSKKEVQPSPTSTQLGQISGHVYRAATAEPISKAQVELFATDQATLQATGGARIVRSGADGSFTLADLPPGDYRFEVWHAGFVDSARQPTSPASTEQSVTLGPGQKVDNVVLRLYPAGVVTGQIVDEDHDPVSGLQVYILSVVFVHGGHRQIHAAGRATTDDQGNFRVANLPPGLYYIRAGGLISREMQEVGLKQGPAGGAQYRNGYYPGTPSLEDAQAVRVHHEETANIQLTVSTEGTYTIIGKVLPKAGTAMGRVDEIECTSKDAEGYMFSSDSPTVSIDPDGSFNIPRMPPGDYTLSAASIRNGVQAESGYAQVRVVDSDVRANIELGRTTEVRGKVEAPQGFSFSGKQISLLRYGPGFYLVYQGAIDSTGGFVIEKIPPGEFTFDVLESTGEKSEYVKKAICNGRDYASVEFTLTFGTLLDCTVTLGSDAGMIRGIALDGDKPAPNMSVVLIPESKELRRIPRYTQASKTDSSGAFTISAVIPGNYLMFAVRPNREHSYFALDFADVHAEAAERVSVNSGSTQVVNLKISRSD